MKLLLFFAFVALLNVALADVRFAPVNKIAVAGSKIAFSLSVTDNEELPAKTFVGLYKKRSFWTDKLVAKVELFEGAKSGSIDLPLSTSGTYYLRAFKHRRFFQNKKLAQSDKFNVLPIGSRVMRFSKYSAIKDVSIEGGKLTVSFSKNEDSLSQKLIAKIKDAATGEIVEEPKSLSSPVASSSDVFVELYAGHKLVYRSTVIGAPGSPAPASKKVSTTAVVATESVDEPESTDGMPDADANGEINDPSEEIDDQQEQPEEDDDEFETYTPFDRRFPGYHTRIMSPKEFIDEKLRNFWKANPSERKVAVARQKKREYLLQYIELVRAGLIVPPRNPHVRNS